MNTLLKIRAMTSEDVAAVSEIEKTCFNDAWSENLIKGELDNGNAVVFVAQYRENVVGYINFYNIVGEGNINRIAVLPQYRKQGIADALMKAMLGWAKENKLVFVTLEVRQSNTAAISLYRKYGFENVGIRNNFYSAPVEDAVLMTLDGEKI